MLAAIIPIKDLRCAKSRLSPLLTGQQRADLSIAMLRDMLGVMRCSSLLDVIIVVSPDPNALQAAAEGGAIPLVESEGNLNGAISFALGYAAGLGATETIVLPGDLPLITLRDIAAVVGARPAGGGIVLSPTWDGGTGALLVPIPHPIAPAYGPRSFSAHAEAARLAGVEIAVRHLPNLASDVDRPEDVTTWLHEEGTSHTSLFMKALGIGRGEIEQCM